MPADPRSLVPFHVPSPATRRTSTARYHRTASALAPREPLSSWRTRSADVLRGREPNANPLDGRRREPRPLPAATAPGSESVLLFASTPATSTRTPTLASLSR